MTFEELQKANELISTTNIKGKEYAEVNQRVKAFRSICPNGQIITMLFSDDGGKAIMRALVYDDNDNLLASGFAYEKESSSYINKTSYIENCETSAVGRALGFAGFGIDTNIASKEEVENAINQQNKIKENENRKINEHEIMVIQENAKATGADINDILAYIGKERLEDCTGADYGRIIEIFQKKKRNKRRKAKNEVQSENN